MSRVRGWSRREFLWFGWVPFFHRKQIQLAGARFRTIRQDRPSRHFLVIHGDEESARVALTRFMRSHEGIAFLIEGRTRNVPIEGGMIDPNRMFSRGGAEASLKNLNPGWSPGQIEKALDLLDRGREQLVKALLPPDRGLLIALHNNSEAYSVNDEVPISDATSLYDSGNPHAFFICTDPADFGILKQSPYNVVLQREKPQQDDGSLSRLAARQGARYVNLEVRQGDADRQWEMLLWADGNLG